jgi:TolA-binding protein
VADLQAFLGSKPPRSAASDARFALAMCQLAAKQPKDAIGTLETLLAEDPEYPGKDKALYELGWALKEQGDVSGAAKAFARLAKETPRSGLAAEALFHVGEEHYRREDYAKAGEAFYAAADQTDDADLEEKSLHKLGWCRYRQDQFSEARETFAAQRKRFGKGPLAGDAAFMEGECLFQLKQFEAALAAYAAVGQTTSDEYPLLLALHSGQALAQLERWAESLERLEAASKQYPDTLYLPELLYEQGRALQQLGRGDEAVRRYEQVTQKTDREVAARARFMIGEVYFEKKDHAEAVRQFFKVAYGYGYPEWQAAAQYESGRCFEVLGKLEQARQSYREVVEKYGKTEYAARAQARLDELAGK